MAKINNELRGYQSIPRDLIFDTTISDRARFVYCFMVAKPDGWDFFLEPMANELRYTVATLRKYIKELIDNGWLVKGKQEKDNGRFAATEYTIKARKIAAKDKSPCYNFYDTEKNRHGKNHTLTDIYNININNNNIYNNKRKIPKEKFAFDASLLALGISEQLVKEYMFVRKKKKAVNTETAFKGLQREIEKARVEGISAEDCIRTAVEHDWKGFRFDWFKNLRATNRGKSGQGLRSNHFDLENAKETTLDDWMKGYDN